VPAFEIGGRTVPLFDLVIVLGSGLCVAAVLVAVASNHLFGRSHGQVERRERNPIATASMLGFFAVVLVLLRLGIGVVALDGTARRAVMLTGLALLALGAAVNVAGRLRLGRNWADQVTVYSDQTLATTGVYGLVRHPLYASLVWMFTGGALVYRNAAVLAATVLVFVPAMVLRARHEERLLAERFPEYEAYRDRVGMLLPRLPWHTGRR
jgi:protein-S-isoprenylcysteine O-methyltransferase Ste14